MIQGTRELQVGGFGRLTAPIEHRSRTGRGLVVHERFSREPVQVGGGRGTRRDRHPALRVRECRGHQQRVVDQRAPGDGGSDAPGPCHQTEMSVRRSPGTDSARGHVEEAPRHRGVRHQSELIRRGGRQSADDLRAGDERGQLACEVAEAERPEQAVVVGKIGVGEEPRRARIREIRHGPARQLVVDEVLAQEDCRNGGVGVRVVATEPLEQGERLPRPCLLPCVLPQRSPQPLLVPLVDDRLRPGVE